MRTRAKVDSNQPLIVATFEALGFTVAHTHMIGKGFADIVVGKHDFNVLVEIKDGAKPPSARKLTPAEKDFHDAWRGRIEIVESIADVRRISREIDVLASMIARHGAAA